MAPEVIFIAEGRSLPHLLPFLIIFKEDGEVAGENVLIKLEGLKLEVLGKLGKCFCVTALNSRDHSGKSFGLVDLVNKGCPNGININDEYDPCCKIFLWLNKF